MDDTSAQAIVKAASAAAVLLYLAGCASSGPARAPARVTVEPDVGFTITESSRIGGSARADYEEALILLEQGHTDRGIALLATVVESAPGASAPRVDLAIAYHRAGDLDKAQEHLLLALEHHPEHAVAHNELGIVYRKIGQLAEARESYENALRIYPAYHVALRNLAVLCDLYLADLPCAQRNYEAYLATVRADDEATMWLADVRTRLAREAQ